MHIVFSESWNYFYHFFRIFNLDIFRALILQICIWSMYLVSATPPTVFGESFWNFTGVLRMVWRYAYCFFRILKLFFITFYAFLTWTFFEPLYYRYVYGVCTLYRQLLLQFLVNPFETLQMFYGWSGDMHIVFSESCNLFTDFLQMCHRHWYRRGVVWDCKWDNFIQKQQALDLCPKCIFGQYLKNE